jgi:hypothetical protein
MTLAPSWLPRQQRRHVDRALQKLLRRGVCSICGGTLRHNSPTASGFDAHGTVAVAGECCFDRLAQVFGFGLYSDRQYDFLGASGGGSELPPERIVEAFAAHAKAIAETDKLLADAEQRGGGIRAGTVVTRDYPWKSDDKLWFEQHPKRSHRMRSPFPGEVDELAAQAPPGHVPIIAVRQIEKGFRLRPGLYLSIDLLPVPDDEATAHALFEAAVGREAVPKDDNALRALAEKYTAHKESSQ